MSINHFLDVKILEKYREQAASGISIGDVLKALSEFMECVRYLNTRRSNTTLQLDNEGAVQDALYLMLRPWIADIIPESPSNKIANRYSIKDFLIPSLKTVIEVKFIRDASHGKNVVQEINDDIETYRYHALCDHLIFFIYDSEVLIPDRLQLEKHINGKRNYTEKTLQCYSIIRP
jgi:hypothetical protein